MNAPLHKQRGVAILTAMLVVTVAAIIGANLMWQATLDLRRADERGGHRRRALAPRSAGSVTPDPRGFHPAHEDRDVPGRVRRRPGHDPEVAARRRGDGERLDARDEPDALDDPRPLLYHYEPILRDGKMVGHVTSAAYGHTLGRAVALGYVHEPEGVTPEFVNGGSFEVEIAFERHKAKASLRPMYDPTSARMRV